MRSLSKFLSSGGETLLGPLQVLLEQLDPPVESSDLPLSLEQEILVRILVGDSCNLLEQKQQNTTQLSRLI